MNKKVLFSTALALSINVYAQIPTTGIVSNYQFSGNANDVSINANNGNVIGATLTADRFGNTNSAYNFNGTSNYIEVLNSPSLQFASNLQTVSFWMKIPSIPNPLDLEGVIEKMNQNLGTDATGSSAQGFQIVFAPDGSLYYSIKNGAGNNWGSVAITSNKYQINQYCNIAFTNDNDSLRAYVNSVKVNATKIPAGTVIGANNLSMLIGKSVWMSNGASMDFFNGILDDIAIYDRALTASEIQQLFANGCSNPDVTSNTISNYQFSGNANDVSINANNGNVIGATLTADRFGNVNSAYNFNGTSNYIEVLNSPSLEFASNLQTVSFWMKIPSIPNPLDLEGVIEKMDQNLGTDATGSSAQGFQIVFAPDGSLYYSIKNGAGNNWGSVAITSNKYQINQYCNIAFTNDNDSLRAYVNSVKVNATKIPAGTVIGANNLSMLIGKSVWMSNGASMNYFNGILDDIAIYDRALTQCDIDSIYNMPNHSTTGINKAEKINLTIVFPNPTTEKINLKITEPTDVKIYNYAGQVIKIFKNSIGQIDVSDLNNGIYFLELHDQNSNQISIHKFMKN